jgi:hypothetical protein
LAVGQITVDRCIRPPSRHHIKRISLRHVNFGVVATRLRGHCVAVAKREPKKKSKKKNCTNMKIEHCCKICHAPYNNVKTTTSPFSTVTLMIRRHYKKKKLSRPQRSKCLVQGNNLYSFFLNFCYALHGGKKLRQNLKNWNMENKKLRTSFDVFK